VGLVLILIQRVECELCGRSVAQNRLKDHKCEPVEKPEVTRAALTTALVDFTWALRAFDRDPADELHRAWITGTAKQIRDSLSPVVQGDVSVLLRPEPPDLVEQRQRIYGETG
jgi:hypothetical protein